MDPSYLDQFEFNYECQIREIDPNHPDSLNMLCDRITSEDSGTVPKVEKILNSLNKEIAALRSQAEGLLNSLNSQDIVTDTEASLRAQAKLWHLQHRIDRVKRIKPNYGTVTAIDEVVQKGFQLLDQVLKTTDAELGAVGGTLNFNNTQSIVRSTPATSMENISIMGGKESLAGPVMTSPVSNNIINVQSNKNKQKKNLAFNISPFRKPPISSTRVPNANSRNMNRIQIDQNRNKNFAQSDTGRHDISKSNNALNTSLPLTNNKFSGKNQSLLNQSIPISFNNDFDRDRQASNPRISCLDLQQSRPEALATDSQTNFPNLPFVANNSRLGSVPPFSRPSRPYFRSTSPLKRWNLSFSGSRIGLPIEEFLFRLESLAVADRVSEDTLAAHVNRFLSDKALTWYWLFRRANPLASWRDVRRALLDEFRSQTTDFEIRQAMFARHQKIGESFSDFRLEMQSLASRLRHPMSQQELIDIIRRNMNARLRNALLLHTVTSLDELRDLARKFEKLWSETDLRVRPRNVSEVYSPYDFCAFDEMPHQISSDVYDAPHDLSHQIAQISVNPSQVSRETNVASKTDLPMSNVDLCALNNLSTENYVCWNCDAKGHSFRECTVAKRNLFCYKCGLKGVTTPICKNCTSENGVSNGMHSGAPRLIRRFPDSKTPAVSKKTT